MVVCSDAILFLRRENGLSLWQAKMRTGVMHQIRLHAAFAGIALDGDKRYGGEQAPSFFPTKFALHHLGMKTEGWCPVQAPVLEWWPGWTRETFQESQT